MIKVSFSRWYIVLSLFLLPLLACGLGPKKTELPKPPSGYIEPNKDAVDRTRENFNQALQEASGNNEFRFRITNEEITSLVALELKKRADIPVSNPQIWFTAGKVYMTGKLEGLGPASVPALIVGIPTVNENDQLQVKLDEAKMGSFDVPDSVIENLTETINETLANIQLNIKVTAIDVLEGELLIAGKRVAN